jgi:membrane-bound lytic murein transglycosylase B
VSRKFGIPPHLLQAVSIVESQQGKYTGTHRVSEVVNATQLKYLNKIARFTNRPPTEFTGSYAGAMGYMQIIPSTFCAYAQDGDGDGIKDPLNPKDNLGTAAYFLAWKIAQNNGSIKAALRSYNNSSRYVNKVYALYRKLRAGHVVAEVK